MTQKFKLVLIAALALLLGSGVVWLRRPLAQSGIGGPFELVDSAGHGVTDAAFRGKYMLVYFGYTNCPDVCPTTLADVADALDTLGAQAAAVQPVFITIDPARDTAAVMGAYVANFGPRWVGLTGSAGQVADVARKYRVYYAEHRTGEGPQDYSMDHSSILYLMAPDGRFVAPLPADAPPESMAANIARHMT